MTIELNQEENKTVLHMDGRLDSNTSTLLQEKIAEVFLSATNVVLDFDKVSFISSAGLRVLLIGHKTATSKGGTMELIHVSQNVFKVLENVGFAKFLSVQTKD